MYELYEEQNPEQLLNQYLALKAKRSVESKRNFLMYCQMMQVEPLPLLKVAKEKPKQVEFHIQKWIGTTDLAPSSMRTILSSVKAYLEYGDAAKEISWKRLKSMIPKSPKAKDREVLASEVSLIHDGGNKRLRFLNTLLYSSGIRYGAFEYQVRPKGRIDYLRMKDLEIIEVSGQKIGKLTVYREDIEEYTTFCSTECLECFEDYLNERRLDGEKITPDSPLVVLERRPFYTIQSRFTHLGKKGISMIYYQAWEAVGLPAEKRKFHLLHGFRKAFSTRLEFTNMKSAYIERLKGHFDTYFRSEADVPENISETDLAVEYAKNMHALALSEKWKEKFDKVKMQEKFDEKESHWQLEAMRMKEDIAGLKEYARLKKLYDEERDPVRKRELGKKIKDYSII